MGLDIRFYKRTKCPKCGEYFDVEILYWGKDRELHREWTLNLHIPPEREILADSSTFIFEMTEEDIDSLKHYIETNNEYKRYNQWFLSKVNILSDIKLFLEKGEKLIYHADW